MTRSNSESKKNMLKKLQHTNPTVAQQIRNLWQVSYPYEAKLLGATDFPPLNRTLEEFIHAENDFYGFFDDDVLAGATEIIHNSEYTHIRSLVVDPTYFRKGIASKLVQFTLDNYTSNLFIVETGAANGPACALYEKFGFQFVEEFDTPIGIRKAKFEKHVNP